MASVLRMDSAEDISSEIELNGPLDFIAGAPLPDEAVSDLLDLNLDTAARLKVCITSKGGEVRHVIKPSVTKFGDATCVEVGDVLQAIAWAHCSKAGVKGRYCVEIYPRDAKGRVGKVPAREYFDLSPDGDTSEVEGPTDRPSPSYVRALELTNERTLRILQDTARSVIRRDEQYHRDRIVQIAAKGQAEVDLARVGVERIEAEGRGSRKDAIIGVATSMLPKAITTALAQWETVDGGTVDESLPPAKRIEAYLDAAELKVFIDVLGEGRWTKMKDAATIADCREILAAFTKADGEKMVKGGIAVAKLTAIASWEDKEPEEKPKQEAEAESEKTG